MKIKDFAKVSDVRGDDVFIHDGERGTKTIKASDLPYALFEDLPLMHKNVFRGKNLGTRMTADQIARVRDGSFKDLWIGDYWASDGMPWRIVDINYWNVHNALTIPHLVIMPDRSLYKQSMYDNDTTSSNSFWGSKVWNSIGQCGTSPRRCSISHISVRTSTRICLRSPVAVVRGNVTTSSPRLWMRLLSSSFLMRLWCMDAASRSVPRWVRTVSTRCPAVSSSCSGWDTTLVHRTQTSGFATRHI